METTIEIQDFPLWEKVREKNIPLSFSIELSARCNLNCRHCYINLPAGDQEAWQKELSLEELSGIAKQAASLGAVWCLITGGEPLLRRDFQDVYLAFRRAGLLLSVFTNATLITDKHIDLFKKYPPRDIEVTVYGATQETYEAVTRVPGSFAAFKKGLDKLIESGIRIRLKAMALRSNLHELETIHDFCRQRTKDYYRFDPVLHFRYDGNPIRNEEIRSERLRPDEIVALEKADKIRFESLSNNCQYYIQPEGLTYEAWLKSEHSANKDIEAYFSQLFDCGIGINNFDVSYDGKFKLCSDLNAPETIIDLRKVSLQEAWSHHVHRVRELHLTSENIKRTCKSCSIKNLCMYCPARAHLETGDLEGETPYFCAVAHARAEAIQLGLDKQDLDQDSESS